MALPTLCEVNYDKSDVWDDPPADTVPYRYRSLSARVNNKDVQNGFVHRDIPSSASFYEMPSYYRVPSAQTMSMDLRRPNTVFSNYSNQGLPPSRAGTLPPSYPPRPDPSAAPTPSGCDQCGPTHRTTSRTRDARARTAPCKSLPNLDAARLGASSVMSHQYHRLHNASVASCPGATTGAGEHQIHRDENVKWVPALNTWVAEKNNNPVPYVTFVNSMSLKDRGLASETAITEEEILRSSHNGPCGRFLSHMHLQEDAAKALFAQKQAQIIRKRRLRYERDEKMHTSRSQPVIPPKSPTKVRFERQPSPPPPAPPPAPVKTPVKPSLPAQPAPPVRVFTKPRPVPKTPSPPPPPPRRRTPTPEPESPPVPEDPAEDLADSIRDASLREPTPQPLTPLPPTPPPPPPRTPTPKIPTPLPREPTPPPKPPTPIPIEDIEETCCPSPIPQPTPPPPPKPASPPPCLPCPETPARPKPKPEKQKNPKEKPLKPKPNKKPKVEKRPKADNGKKNKEKAAALPTVHVQQEPPSLELTVQGQDRVSTEIHSSDFGDDSSTGTPPPGTRKDKRVRWRAAPKSKVAPEDEASSTPSPRMPVFAKRRVTDWIWSDDDEDFSIQLNPGARDREENSSMDPLPSPSPPPSSPSPPPPPVEKPKPPPKKKLPVKPKKKIYGPRKVDKSLQEQMERDRLAEERRQKLLGRQKRKSVIRLTSSGSEFDGPRFEDYGFLAKYCIFNKEKLDMYKRIFDNVDEEGRGWLSGEEIQLALRVVNKALTAGEQRYLTRILEMTGYNADDGADFKLFSVMAALSQRITGLDEWLRLAIDNIDLQQLDMKMYMCKTMWECNVDPNSNKMPLDHLCVELRAGGVSAEHEQEVRDKLGHLASLDLLDFLAYIPLFIVIHESVISNPFDVTRNK